jgi:hypothetical protein
MNRVLKPGGRYDVPISFESSVAWSDAALELQREVGPDVEA